MRISKLMVAGLIAAFSGTSLANGQAQQPNLEIVTELHRNEISQAHLFHSNHLWIAQSRASEHTKHRVEIYSANGEELLATMPLNHSVDGLFAYGASSAVAVGRSSTPYWRTHYTVFQMVNGRWASRTYTFPERFQVNEFARLGNTLYFNEPGSRAVLQVPANSTRVQALPVQVSGPGKMVTADQGLWIIENNALGFGDENLVHIDLKNHRLERVFSELRNGLVELLPLEGTPYLAVSETETGKVLLVDRQSRQLLYEVAIKGEPRGLAQAGHCLIVADSQNRELVKIDLSENPPIATQGWDLSGAGEHLTSPRKVAINTAGDTVFVRSAYACPSCQTTQSSVYRLSAAPGELLLADCVE